MCHFDCLFRACRWRSSGSDFLNLNSREAGYFSSLKDLPLTRISLILTSTKFWRCPCIFLYCFLRLSLKTRTLSPRPSLTTEARTLAPLRSDSNLPSSALTARTSENSSLPSSWAVVSIFNCSPGETRYCLPPVRMTAYMTKTSSVALVGADRFSQKMLYGAETEDLHPTGWRNRQSS